MRRRVFLLSQVILVLAITGILGVTAVSADSDMGAPGIDLPADVPADWWQSVQEDIRRSEYQVSWQENTLPANLPAAFQAPNRAQNLRSYFTPEGVHITPRQTEGSVWQWGLAFEGYGYSGHRLTLPAAELVYDGNRIEYRRCGLVEWYINDERGLEQGFTLEAPPGAPELRGELRFQMRILGDLQGTLLPGSEAIEFKTDDGATVLRYGELTAHDADGRLLPCQYELFESQLALVVDDSEATYPVVIDPLATSPSWTAESNSDYSGYGFSVASAGDVNGDGFGDIIVGAYMYDGGEWEEGYARLYRGSATGPVSTGWSVEIDQVGAQLGYSVSTAGDVNGDGYSDVVVGVPFYTDIYVHEGAVFVYYGSSSGLSTSTSWIARGAFNNIGLGTMVATAGDLSDTGYSGVLATTRTTSGRIYLWYGGSAGMGPDCTTWECDWLADIDTNPVAICSAGDVNGDGHAEILASSYSYDNGETDEGAAFMWFGPLGADGTTANADWHFESNITDRKFGAAVSSAGDVNGDGYGDIIVGIPYFDGGSTNEGRAVVFHGSATGPSTTHDWGVNGDQTDQRLGCSVAGLGDINGDGRSDVAIGGAYFDDFDQSNNTEGWARVYFGGHGGLAGAAGWSDSGGQDHAAYGICVAAAGDINGDGFADLLVGAPGYVAGQPREGRIFLYLGSSDTLAESLAWEQFGNSVDCHYGQSVSTAGDVNGDGYADLIVGADHYNGGGTMRGGAWLFEGSGSGLSSTASWSATGENDNDLFGFSVASAGDINGDGYSDVIVGAIGYDRDTALDAGRIYVYHGSGTGLSAGPDWIATCDQIQAFFGCAVDGAGDVNGDGYSDIIVGARGWDAGLLGEGLACLWHGSRVGLGPEGVIANADWMVPGGRTQAAFGASVASAGDINADGFSDVIIGAPDYNSGSPAEGMAFVWLGSALSLPASGSAADSDWSAESNFAQANLGTAVAAGDFNCDGYADVAVGAPGYQFFDPYEGAVFMWFGSELGLVGSGTPANADWYHNGGQATARLGTTVAPAGDVNGDGYADLVVGAPFYRAVDVDDGLVYVYHGSDTGLVPRWFKWGDNAYSRFGGAVGSAGDVNGDGYADVAIGEEGYTGTILTQGRCSLYYGNGGHCKRIRPRQKREDNTGHIDRLCRSDSEVSFRIAAFANSPFGREGIKLEWEVKELGVLLDGTGLERSVDWTDPGVNGAHINELVTGLDPNLLYHWRARFIYDMGGSPFAQHSRWFTRPWNGWQEADLRMASDGTAVVEQVPSGFKLHQNVPNPFNPTTQIAFSIPDTGVDRIDATLSIYDVQGRLLRSEDLSDLTPGHHEVSWDGRNDRGLPVASGVYCYQIEVGTFRSVKKMMLLK